MTKQNRLKECPEGVVHEDCFKDIYAKFFPHGSKFILVRCLRRMTNLISFLVETDSSLYAHYVFKAFDVNCSGAISFRVSFIVTLLLPRCLGNVHKGHFRGGMGVCKKRTRDVIGTGKVQTHRVLYGCSPYSQCFCFLIFELNLLKL